MIKGGSMLKPGNLKVLFLLGFVICNYSQWVQSNLNAGLGRSLYSDGKTIYAASNQGVYITEDKGDPWFLIGPNDDDIFSVITSGNNIIAGSGMGKGIRLSSDKGNTWREAASMIGQSVYSLAKNENYVFAGTWTGGVFRSSDNGETWVNTGLKDKSIRELITAGNTVYAAVPELYSRIYYSDDNGVTWNYASLSYPASDPRGLLYTKSKLFVGDIGLWVSNDAGRSYNLLYGIEFDNTGYPKSTKLFRAIETYNDYLVASVMGESIKISKDNGLSWGSFNEGINTDWTFADVKINGNYIWILREFFGNAYRRPLQEIITSVDEDIQIPTKINLSQNYPNPFGEKAPGKQISTNIKYFLPQQSSVNISVYDILGRKIITLIDEIKNSGEYITKFDINSVPSHSKISTGVYFCKLRTPEYSVTRKMIIIR